MNKSAPIDAAGLAMLLQARPRPGTTVIGLTGSVAVGKSTLAGQIAAALPPDRSVAIIGTDAWLLPNAVLDAQGLTLRKGFPESYDRAGLAALPDAIRSGPIVVPGYSHRIYDVDPALARTVAPPDVLIVEGLGFSGPGIADRLDLLVYLDAEEADLERWFLDRFMRYWHAAADDPDSFYTRFRGLSEAAARDFGRRVWEGINLVNLREHIIHVRQRADIIVKKAPDHGLALIRA